MIEFDLQGRTCDCCLGDDLEELYSYEHVARGRSSDYRFRIRNVVCRSCGFAFVSPAPSQKQLDAYYADCFAHFAGQPATSNVNVRAENIAQRVPAGLDGIEIGGNTLVADTTLRAHFRSFVSVEPNKETAPQYTRIDHVPSSSADVIVHYYVLEHAQRPREFLSHCHRILRPGGTMLCEVPDLQLFPRHVSELLWWEHLSHFSIRSLVRIAHASGFVVSDVAHRCSNDRGMLAVFTKGSAPANPVTLPLLDRLEYLDARAAMRDGLVEIERFNASLERARQSIREVCDRGQAVTLWGANDVMRRLLADPFILPPQAVVMDDDARKRDFIPGTKVAKPAEAVEHLARSRVLIVASSRLAEVILARATELAGNGFAPDVRIIDYETPSLP